MHSITCNAIISTVINTKMNTFVIGKISFRIKFNMRYSSINQNIQLLFNCIEIRISVYRIVRPVIRRILFPEIFKKKILTFPQTRLFCMFYYLLFWGVSNPFADNSGHRAMMCCLLAGMYKHAHRFLVIPYSHTSNAAHKPTHSINKRFGSFIVVAVVNGFQLI